MTKERLSELRELLFMLERRIAPLEWDASRNQINEFKKLQLGKLKAERQALLQELQELERPPLVLENSVPETL
ncbi:MAG TPA: hypothetical protein VJI32_05350 [Candidatus Nanoarchaeia archaeon]|nr:hypothetical protein [Candidatus Nanoarchaeia archaeon]